MSYLRSDLLAQAARAGRQTANRPPEVYEKMGIIKPQAAEGTAQPIAETVAIRQTDRANQEEHRTTKHGGGGIEVQGSQGKEKSPDNTLLIVSLIALLAFALMKR